MTKKLPAFQRDMMLIKLAREELELKKKMSETLQQSMQQNERTIQAMTKSISEVGAGMKEGMALLAQALQQNNQPAYYQAPSTFPQQSSPHLNWLNDPEPHLPPPFRTPTGCSYRSD